jgi:hypothetical protein
MVWQSLIEAALQSPVLIALITGLVALVVGQQVIKAKDEQIKTKEEHIKALGEAKEEQLKAKDAIIAQLETLAPARILDHVVAQKTFFEQQIEFVEQRSRDAQEQLSRLGDASSQEAESLRVQLRASQDQIGGLTLSLRAAEKALRELERLRGDAARLRLELERLRADEAHRRVEDEEAIAIAQSKERRAALAEAEDRRVTLYAELSRLTNKLEDPDLPAEERRRSEERLQMLKMEASQADGALLAARRALDEATRSLQTAQAARGGT